jgi:hypothetical protein
MDKENGVVLSEGKEEKIKQLKKDYDNAMAWVNRPEGVPKHELVKWEAQARKIADHAKKQYKIDIATMKNLVEGVSPYKPNAKVKIISGPKDVVGKEGYIGEIKTDVQGKKTYVIDISDGSARAERSVTLQPKDIRLVKGEKVKESATQEDAGWLKEGIFGKKKMTAMQALNAVANEKHKGYGFDTLDLEQAEKLVNMKMADAIAMKRYGKKFWPLSKDEQEFIINAHPGFLRGDALIKFKAQ